MFHGFGYLLQCQSLYIDLSVQDISVKMQLDTDDSKIYTKCKMTRRVKIVLKEKNNIGEHARFKTYYRVAIIITVIII